MKESLLKYIVCPSTLEPLDIEVFKKSDNNIIDGILYTGNKKNIYPVIGGIPRFVDKNKIIKDIDTHYYFNDYSKELSKFSVREFLSPDKSNTAILDKTSKSFGIEWDHFRDWGWIPDDSVPEYMHGYEYFGGLISNTEAAFKSKCKMSESDISSDKIVLDAGCGNGRYTNQAAQLGATVIGVDLGFGVKSAYKHTKKKQNIHIIQGDLFKLPFKDQTFDSAFSNGVLMHTGDANKAFKSVASKVKSGGVFVAHLYHKRNFMFELIDTFIRFFTTKFGAKINFKFASLMARIGRRVKRKGTLHKWRKYLQVLPTEHHMFDWYTAPVATFHTHSEVESWFEESGFQIIDSDKGKWPNPEAVNVKGKKR